MYAAYVNCFMKNMQALLPPGSSLAAMRPPARQSSQATA